MLDYLYIGLIGFFSIIIGYFLRATMELRSSGRIDKLQLLNLLEYAKLEPSILLGILTSHKQYYMDIDAARKAAKETKAATGKSFLERFRRK